MGKIRFMLENMRSCYSCFYSKEGINEMKYSKRVYCLKEDKMRGFRKWCPNYVPMDCSNCGFCSKIDGYKVVKVDKKPLSYRHFYKWVVDCKLNGVFEEYTLTNKLGKLKQVPSCSLWQKKEVEVIVP